MSDEGFPGGQPPPEQAPQGSANLPPYPGPYAPPEPAGGVPGPYGGPSAYGAPPGPYGGEPPPAYLPWAIIAAVGGVLFSLILGLPVAAFAIRSARQVPARWEAGDQEGARRASRTALTLCIIATVLDLLGLILVIVLFSRGNSGTTSG